MRDRLIELLKQKSCVYVPCDNECGGCKNVEMYDDSIESIADHFLAEGVIVPPCKVGDTVYRLDDIVWDDECRDCEHYLIGGFGDPSECGKTRYGYKHPNCIKIIEKVVTQHDIYYWLYSNAFGKTVFLTREEAEKTLTKRRIDND